MRNRLFWSHLDFDLSAFAVELYLYATALLK